MAIAVAQQVSTPAAGSSLSNATGTTQTVSITASAGSTLVALTRGEGGPLTVTVADPTNGSYTALDTAGAFAQYNWATFVKQNVAGGTVLVTATWSATNVNRGIIVLEITGATTSGGAQAHIVATGGNSSGAMTIGIAPALVIGFGAGAVGSVFAAGSGFTAGTTCWSSSGDNHLPEWQRFTGTGSQAATFTGGGANDQFFGVVLTEAGGGAAAQVPFRRQAVVVPDEDPIPQRRRLFVPAQTAAPSAFVPFRRQQRPQEPDPQYLFMGLRSATIQSGSSPVTPDNPPPGWPQRIISLQRWVEDEPPPLRRRFLSQSAPVVVPDNPPIGWPRRLAMLFLRPDDGDQPTAVRRQFVVSSVPVVVPPFEPGRLTIVGVNVVLTIREANV